MQSIRVQKHIQEEECDFLLFSSWSTEVFKRNRIKDRLLLLFTDTPTTIDNGIKISS